ncbi:MAG: hypothetical protein Q7U02_03185 [Desulfosalsimonadaceae bacterium]|nr:hypothetical protein [Desulfosalsimonadaceae bacterium]
MAQDNCAVQKEFAFDSLPVSVEMIQDYIQRFFPRNLEKGNWIQALLLKTALGLIRRLPISAAWYLGAFIGYSLYFIKIRSDVAAVNLDIVYGDTKSASEKKAIYKASLINFGHVIVNYLRLPFAGESFWSNHCELVNQAVLKEAINQKKGVLFVGGHIGMWDMAGGKVGMSGYPTSVVAKKIGNPVVNRFVADARSSMNMGQIANKNTMERIFASLKRGEAIVLAHPELWFWIHKRWKIRPEGEANPYERKPKKI